VVFTEASRSKSFGFELVPELVQEDLANRVELVFDFSDMVQNIYDTDRVISQQQIQHGPWYDAKVFVMDLQIQAQCRNPITIEQIPKY
jgi:hypothetical protein